MRVRRLLKRGRRYRLRLLSWECRMDRGLDVAVSGEEGTAVEQWRRC